MLFIQHYDSPLGGVLLAADNAGLTGLWFNGAKYFAANRLKRAKKSARRFWMKRRAGWISILQADSRISRRRCI